MRFVLAVLALLVAVPAQAEAARCTVTGTDSLTWEPNVVDVQPGDTVVWTFPGTTQAHNVKSETPNWELDSPLGAPPAPDAEYTFTAEGTYHFICEVHPTRCSGTCGSRWPRRRLLPHRR